MSYQVLARKWRPKNFHELVGQEHVQRALVNALDNDRLHHAYLFTGTRGVGKTTIARIFAKSLNCETGVTSSPCGECSSCTEINEGRFVDLIEVDAASRTKVEDTRELLDNVQYSPTRGRYKVYLIDEVHMLSNHSFNALLKTLEEPPPHVKFLLATTDPQKLPVTILSRCLQFNLKQLPADLIADYLVNLMGHEKIKAELKAIQHIAQAADGSMRDALSLMDQAIAYCSDQVTESDVSTMLGTIEQHHIIDLLNALNTQQAEQALKVINTLAQHSPDYISVLNELLNSLHEIAVLQISTTTAPSDNSALNTLANQFAAEDIQLFYQIALIGKRDLGLAPDPKRGFEMVILRMLSFQPDTPGMESRSTGSANPDSVNLDSKNAASDLGSSNKTQQNAASRTSHSHPENQAFNNSSDGNNSRQQKTHFPPTQGTHQQTPNAVPAANVGNTEYPTTKPDDLTPPSYVQEADLGIPKKNNTIPKTQAVPTLDIDPNALEWEQIVEKLSLVGINHQLAVNCSLVNKTADAIHLSLSENHKQLLNDKRLGIIEQTINNTFSCNIKLHIEAGKNIASQSPAVLANKRAQQKQQQAINEISDDQNIRNLVETFDAQVTPGTIEPID